MGYVARPAARQLASRKTGNVGFALRTDHFARSEPFYTHVFLGAEFEADLHDRYVLLATIPESYTPGEDTPRFLRERNVDGILVAGKVATEFVTEIEATNLPIVMIDFEANDHAAVVIDNQAGARMAVEHLLSLGHTSIAFVGADTSHPAIAERLDGYRLALATADVALDPRNVIVDDLRKPDFETGRLLADRLFAMEPRPSAVFCVNDAIALGVLNTATRSELSVPGELSVVGFDDVAGARTANPPLTTLRVFKEQLGGLAVRYLEDLIKNATDGEGDEERDAPGQAVDPATSTDVPTRRAHNIKVPVELIIRDSTAPPHLSARPAVHNA
jgi:LacI family transcriptional regulator